MSRVGLRFEGDATQKKDNGSVFGSGQLGGQKIESGSLPLMNARRDSQINRSDDLDYFDLI